MNKNGDKMRCLMLGRARPPHRHCASCGTLQTAESILNGKLRSRLLLSLTSLSCLGEGSLDNFYRVRARFKSAIASFNLSWPVITARTSLTQLENWSLLRGRIFPWTTGAPGGIEWSLGMRWMAGPPLEIYVQSAGCHRGFMENTSEWSRLPHALSLVS